MFGKGLHSVSFALQSLISFVFWHLKNGQHANHQTLDIARLESRVLFSASPLAVVDNGVVDADAGIGSDAWLIQEDYSDGVADRHEPQSGRWSVQNERYLVEPNSNAVSTFVLDEPLEDNLEFNVTINANEASSYHFSNAFLIFDYQNQSDFKFAGAYMGSDQWVIGHYGRLGWRTDARFDAPIDALTDYQLSLRITNDSEVALYRDGRLHVSHTFDSSVTDGQLGLGTRYSVSYFDDLSIRALTTDTEASPGTLPLHETFDNVAANAFLPTSGTWFLKDGQYEVMPEADGDGISTVQVPESLGEEFEAAVTFDANGEGGGQLSNGVIIFDYHGQTDFKYAGAFVQSGEWVIGQRTADQWQHKAVLAAQLESHTAYAIRVVVDGAEVSLYCGNELVVGHQFSDTLNDGAVGLGSYNSVTRFDDFHLTARNVPTSDVVASLEGGDLKITGDATGKLEIVAQGNDSFLILDHGQELYNFEAVTGDLRLQLGDANDNVTLNLGGNRFGKNVIVSLGDGDDQFTVINGVIGGHLRVRAGEGEDHITVFDNVAVGRSAWVRAESDDDTVDLQGNIGRSLYVYAGAGNDTVTIDATIGRHLKVNSGRGEDSIKIGANTHVGRHTWIRGGKNDDLVDEQGDIGRSLFINAGAGNDTVSIDATVAKRLRSSLFK